MNEQAEWPFRKAYLDEVKRGNELADKHIGTLMLLAYEGCISDSRARELIGMDIHTWRKECARILSTLPTVGNEVKRWKVLMNGKKFLGLTPNDKGPWVLFEDLT